MRSGTAIRTIIITMAAVLFCVFITCCRYTGKDTEKHRRSDFTVRYYLNTEANIRTENAVRRAFEEWENVSDFIFIYSGRNKAGLKRDGKNTVSFLAAWPEKAEQGKAAWCLNYYDRKGLITESDIIFNMELTRFTTLETNTPDSYYIEGLLAHEIGHMIGLEHIDSPSSVMKHLSTQAESYFMGKIDEETVSQYKKLYGK